MRQIAVALLACSCPFLHQQDNSEMELVLCFLFFIRYLVYVLARIIILSC